MRILLVGGNSYVARNFIRTASNGLEVTCLVRRESGHPNEILCPDFNTFRFPDGCFDAVVNCAGIVHQKNVKNADQYDRINHRLVARLGRSAKDAGVRRFVQISSISVYGNVEFIGPNTTLSPMTAYGRSKFNAEKALIELSDSQFLVSILRPSMIYGGGIAPGNMQTLINLINRGVPLPLMGAENYRQFLNVNALSQVISQSLASRIGCTENIADTNGISTEDLVHLIAKKLDRPARLYSITAVGRVLLRNMKPLLHQKLFGSLVIDTSKCVAQFGDYSEYGLSEGIAETADAMKSI